jgi:HEAT repeat protein
MAEIARGLRDGRWYVVRNVIYILNQIGKKEATLYLKPLIKHPDIRVRKECINALGALGAQDVLRALQDSLKEEDVSIRLAAIRSIARIGGPLAKKILLDEINSKDFLHKDFNEKKELLEALCQWREPAIEELIIGFFKKRSFFRKSRYTELNAIAAYCLGLLGTERALEVLKKNRNSKNPMIQESIIKAIKRIEDARKG